MQCKIQTKYFQYLREFQTQIWSFVCSLKTIPCLTAIGSGNSNANLEFSLKVWRCSSYFFFLVWASAPTYSSHFIPRRKLWFWHENKWKTSLLQKAGSCSSVGGVENPVVIYSTVSRTWTISCQFFISIYLSAAFPKEGTRRGAAAGEGRVMCALRSWKGFHT